MSRRVDLLQRPDRNLRVYLGHLDVLVAEHLLNIPDVRAALVHQRGHRVAEEMAGAGLAQLGGVHPIFHRPRQMVAAERLTLHREEHGHVVRLDGKLGTALPDILLRPRYRPLSDGDVAVFLALALTHEDEATVERQVVELQLGSSPDGGCRSSTAPPGSPGRAAR